MRDTKMPNWHSWGKKTRCASAKCHFTGAELSVVHINRALNVRLGLLLAPHSNSRFDQMAKIIHVYFYQTKASSGNNDSFRAQQMHINLT